MRALGWAMVAGFLLWLALAQHGMVSGPRALLRRLTTRTGEESVHTLPFCDGCVDHEACGPDVCLRIPPEAPAWGTPERPMVQIVQCPDGDLCAHGGQHWGASDTDSLRTGYDDGDILEVSQESVVHVDVSGDDRCKTKAWKERESREQAARETDGVDLSFLDGAPPEERREWIASWLRAHPLMPRSEIAHLLSKYSGVTLRQAQIDVRAALGPATSRSREV